MEKFLNIVSDNINMAIIVLGIVLIILIISNGCKLAFHKNRIEEALDRRNPRTSINRRTLEINEEEEREQVTPETIRKYEKEFNQSCSRYHTYTQGIPIFPLLGIFGTVAGLMLQVEAETMDAMVASLNLALGSTLWGLFFAIILKIIVAVFPARMIYDVEIMLDDYDKKFNNALVQKNISEE